MSIFAPQRDRIFNDLAGLVSFNSVHSVPELSAEHKAAGAFVENALSELGLEVTRHATVDDADTIIARTPAREGAPTVLLYSHYDVVPAGEPSAWTSDPFTLTERDGRWYARGASDCKGNVAMHLETLRMLCEHEGGLEGLGCNILVVIEGSEELGGGGLEKLINDQPELFAADLILIADSGNVAVGTPTLTTNLRGGAQVRVRVSTLTGALHSGAFGGAAPDPVAALIRMLDSLRDEHGRTVIDGLDCTARWPGEPYTAEAFRADAGVLEGVSLMGDDEQPSDLVWARPAVSVTGFTSTPVAEAINAIVPTAQAQLNLRVPASMDAAEAAEALKQHLINHTPWGAHVEVEIFDINHGFATDPTQPAIALLGRCLQEAYGAGAADVATAGAGANAAPELAIVASGGSIPLTATLQKHFPDAAIVMFGVEDSAAGIHSVDESVHPYEIERVAVAEALFLQRVAQL